MMQKTILVITIVAGLALVLAACQGSNSKAAPYGQPTNTQGVAAGVNSGNPADATSVGGAADAFGNDLGQLDSNGSINDVNITESDLDLGLQ